MDDPTPEDLRQHLLDTTQPGDEDPVGLTRRQAAKLAAILDAYTRGNQHLYYDAVLDGRNLLLAHAYAGQGATGVPDPTTTAAQLDRWPWPT